MAYVYEILTKKRILDKKISELEGIVKQKQTNDMALTLFNFLDQHRDCVLNLDTANNNSNLKIGDQTVMIATAVRVRDNIKKKINFLTELIEDPTCELDKLELQKQRDKFYDEFNTLDMAILQNDLTVSLGGNESV